MTSASIQIIFLAVLMVGSAVTLSNPCRKNSRVQFLPHPDEPAKFIQCTKKGEMFVFKCKNGQEWDLETSQCDSPKEKPAVTAAESKPLVMKSKTKKLGHTGKIRVLTFIDSTTARSLLQRVIDSTTVASTTTTTTTSTTTTTRQSIQKKTVVSTTSTVTIPSTTTITSTSTAASASTARLTAVSNSTTILMQKTSTQSSTTVSSLLFSSPAPDYSYDDVIIQKVRQPPPIMPSPLEQQQLMAQLQKQRAMNEHNINIQNEILRQQHIDEEIKLRQQVEQQKQLLQQKIIAPQLVNDQQTLHQIQNIIHQQERDEQSRQLKTQRQHQQDTHAEHKLNEKVRLEDQVIIQTVLSLDQLDRMHPIFAFRP